MPPRDARRSVSQIRHPQKYRNIPGCPAPQRYTTLPLKKQKTVMKARKDGPVLN